MTEKIKLHEASDIHIHACLAYSNNKKSNNLSTLIYKEIKNNKKILIKILDVILTLSICNIPLRGHRENIKKVTNESGNFLNIVDLLARHVPLLKSHLENPEINIKHLSI